MVTLVDSSQHPALGVCDARAATVLHWTGHAGPDDLPRVGPNKATIDRFDESLGLPRFGDPRIDLPNAAPQVRKVSFAKLNFFPGFLDLHPVPCDSHESAEEAEEVEEEKERDGPTAQENWLYHGS